MKRKLVLLFVLFSFFANAQLRLIKEVENYKANFNSVSALEVVDNDIIISMVESLNPFKAGVFVSNGTLENTYKIDGLENINYTLEGLFKESYIINDEIFLFSNRITSPSNNNRVFKINNTKTAATLIADADVSGLVLRTNNNKIVKIKREYYPSSTVNFERVPDGYNFFVTIFDEKGNEEKSYVFDGNTGLNNPSEDNNFLRRISELFFWNGNYYFTGVNSQNRSDLYYFNNARQYKITKLHVDGNSNTAVRPNNYILSDNYIYFNGLYNTWATPETPVNNPIRHGKEICFTDATLNFGANETAIPNFLTTSANLAAYDGTRGYKALDTNADFADSEPIYENNGVVIYKDLTTNSLNSVDASNTIQTLVSTRNGIDQYFIRNNKLYYLTPEITTTSIYYLYVFDGDINNTKKYQLPANNGDNFKIDTGNPYNISEKENKVFISGYFSNPPDLNRTAIISFNFNTSQFSEEEVFTDDTIKISNIKRYNNGFVFKGEDEKIYSYNAEIRATQITPNPGNGKSIATKTNTLEQLTLNNKVYNVAVSASNLALNEKLKIEMLDSTSTYFKSKISALPNNNYAKVFYRISALNNASHQSTITLSFKDTDFLNPITDEANLAVETFENGNLSSIDVTSVNLTDKTFTITHNFKPSQTLFIKNSTVLSVANFKVKELKVYPNPVNTKLTVFSENSIENISIYNLLGKQVLHLKGNRTQTLNVNTSILKPGIYLIKVKTEDNVFTKKILKK